MFEEYKAHRYILPGYLLVLYTSIFVLIFLDKGFILTNWKEILALILAGGLGVGYLLGYILYQIYTNREWKQAQKKKEEFISSQFLKEEYGEEVKKLYAKFRKMEPKVKEDFLFERDLIRHLMYSRDIPSLGNLETLWSYYVSRKLNGIFVPIFTIFTSILMILFLTYNPINQITDFSDISNQLIWVGCIVVIILIISIFIGKGTKRVWQEIHSLEWFLMIENQDEIKKFFKNFNKTEKGVKNNCDEKFKNSDIVPVSAQWSEIAKEKALLKWLKHEYKYRIDVKEGLIKRWFEEYPQFEETFNKESLEIAPREFIEQSFQAIPGRYGFIKIFKQGEIKWCYGKLNIDLLLRLEIPSDFKDWQGFSGKKGTILGIAEAYLTGSKCIPDAKRKHFEDTLRNLETNPEFTDGMLLLKKGDIFIVWEGFNRTVALCIKHLKGELDKHTMPNVCVAVFV